MKWNSSKLLLLETLMLLIDRLLLAWYYLAGHLVIGWFNYFDRFTGLIRQLSEDILCGI